MTIGSPPFPAGGSAADGAPGAVLAEYHLDARYRQPLLVRFIISGGLTVLLAFAVVHADNPELLVLGSLAGIVALYNGVVFIWRGRFRTRLTADGIEIRGYFSHFVPWAEVRAIRDEGYGASQSLDAGYDVGVVRYGPGSRAATYRRGGGRTGGTTGRRARLGVIRISRHRGKSLVLRAPLVTAWAPDPYFEAKLAELRRLSGQFGTRPPAG
jgi:hypothetical protein